MASPTNVSAQKSSPSIWTKRKKNRPINKKLQKKFDECDKEKQYELYLIMRGNFKI